MLSIRQVSLLLLCYGVFLILAGWLGYAITAEHSTSSLFNGSLFGFILILLGILHRMGRMWTLPASMSAAGIFTVTFLWRGSLQVVMFLQGHHERLAIVVLLAAMALVSLAVFLVLRRTYRH